MVLHQMTDGCCESVCVNTLVYIYTETSFCIYFSGMYSSRLVLQSMFIGFIMCSLKCGQ